MGLWVATTRLGPGERTLMTFPANHSAGARAVGGRVTLSDAALYFTPNRIDALTGGKPLVLERSTVEGVSVADRTADGGPFSGGLRRRLAVSTSTDEVHFVVDKVEERVAEVRRSWKLPMTP